MSLRRCVGVHRTRNVYLLRGRTFLLAGPGLNKPLSPIVLEARARYVKRVATLTSACVGLTGPGQVGTRETIRGRLRS